MQNTATISASTELILNAMERAFGIAPQHDAHVIKQRWTMEAYGSVAGFHSRMSHLNTLREAGLPFCNWR